MRALRSLVLGLVFLAIATFSLRNTEHVQVKYFGVIDSMEAPLFLFVLFSVFLGLLIGGMMDWAERRRVGKVLWEQGKIKEKLQEEIIARRAAILLGARSRPGEAGTFPKGGGE